MRGCYHEFPHAANGELVVFGADPDTVLAGRGARRRGWAVRESGEPESAPLAGAVAREGARLRDENEADAHFGTTIA